MAEYPGFTIWTDAYLADTTDLTTLEHGAYFLLLIAMWRAGGYLPDDDVKLARYTRLGPKQWASMRAVLSEFLTIENGTVTQGRLLDELEKARSRSKKASESARAKYRKTNKVVDANAQAKHSPASASTSTSTSITNKEEDSSLRSLGEHVENDDVKLAFEDWNKLAVHSGLPKAETLNAKRKSSLRARLTECGGIEGWRNALRMIPGSPFLMGENNSGFTATLDFVLQASSFTKLREGNYAKRGNGPQPPAKKGLSAISERLKREIENAGQDGAGSSDSQTVQRLAYLDTERH